MKLIRPVAVTPSVLTASDVPESEAVWSAVTTYALAAVVRGNTVDSEHRAYESLTAGTPKVVTITIASPGVVTWAAHGLAAGTEVLFTTTGALPTGLTASTVYYVVSPATDTFQVSATAGGASINTTGSQSGVQTAVARPNKNKAPADNPTFWLETGATNRWKMFDGSVTSQTENPDSIEVDLTVMSRVDSVALLNIDAATARVVMNDAVEGDVYDETFSLVSPSGIIDWYAYFFEPIERSADLFVTGMPPYASATLTVTLDDAGGTAKCGALVIGQSKQIGVTQYGATVGIQDYSRKEQDAFGNFTVVERAFSKRANFTVWADAGLTDQIQILLARYRAEPIVYVGSETFGSTVIFGFYRDFNEELAYPTHTICTLEIEGLT